MATHTKKHVKRNFKSTELIYRSENDCEEYARITDLAGDYRFRVTIISNNVTTLAKARGALISGPKKQRLERGNLVLIQMDDSTTNKEKYFIIHKYTPEDEKKLSKAGQLVQIVKNDENDELINVLFESDVINKDNNEQKIDDDFIANL